MVLRRYHFCGTDSFFRTTLPIVRLVLFIIYSVSLRESIVVIPSLVTTLPYARLVLFISYSASLCESIVVIHSKKALEDLSNACEIAK